MDIELNKIVNLMTTVQMAALEGDANVTDSDKYISTVNERIGEIEKNIALLKRELTNQGLNDW